MRWKDEHIALTAADLQILSQIHFKVDEIPLPDKDKPRLPPLWSPLSYLLWKHHGEAAPILWREYRELQALVKNRDTHYQRVQIPKNSGHGYRLLEIPDFELRFHQEWIREEILSHLPVDDCAYAYRKGVSVRDCAAVHCGQSVLLHLDIRDFFGSVTEEAVSFALHRATGYPEAMADFLAALCCCHKRLPQGAVTSPQLSNLVFMPLDRSIRLWAQAHHWAYSRYADDIFLSGDIGDPQTAIGYIRDTLAYFGFRLNEEKTRIVRPGRQMRVLGITTNEKLQTTRRYRRQVRQEVYYLLRYGEDAAGVKAAGDYETYLLQLLGKVSFLLQINPDDAQARQDKEQLLQLWRQCPRKDPPWVPADLWDELPFD